MKKVVVAVCASLLLCSAIQAAPKEKKASSQPASSSAPASYPVHVSDSCNVTLDVSQEHGQISPLLMGFNIVFQTESDELWEKGKLDEKLKELKCGVLRFPGGEVTSYYHWNKMIDKGETDTWDPKYKEEKVDQSKFMDLDEYIGHVRAIGCEPVLGINMESGAKFNRQSEGLEEAKALMRYCKEKNFNVKYWFLDNESYLHGGHNALPMRPKQYAELINTYVPAMREIDPNIKTIANWAGGWNPDWQELLSLAGKNIDIADFHLYFRNGGATWNYWLTHPMGMAKKMGTATFQPQGPNDSYEEMINYFKEQARKAGHQIEVASQEWNVGPTPKDNLSRFQVAMMQAEEFGQFINAGVVMSCLWPMHWPGGNDYRTVFDNKTGEPHADFEMFKMYGELMGQTLLKCKVDAPEVYSVAGKSADGKQVLIYLLRKSNKAAPMPTTIDLGGFKAASAKAVSFTAKDLKDDNAQIIDVPVTMNGAFKIDLPAHSFTKITISQ